MRLRTLDDVVVARKSSAEWRPPPPVAQAFRPAIPDRDRGLARALPLRVPGSWPPLRTLTLPRRVVRTVRGPCTRGNTITGSSHATDRADRTRRDSSLRPSSSFAPKRHAQKSAPDRGRNRHGRPANAEGCGWRSRRVRFERIRRPHPPDVADEGLPPSRLPALHHTRPPRDGAGAVETLGF